MFKQVLAEAAKRYLNEHHTPLYQFERGVADFLACLVNATNEKTPSG